ncbi:MAG: DUF998 domain-containing protein [Saprospiraceae bacterium]|nr:DUF998 domain-containing protein [Candidatus Vicinibacter proximus]
MEHLSLLAKLILGSCSLSLICLAILHIVSAEFKPSWRMVSEYALGKHKWLLTSFFILWSIGSILTSIHLWNFVTSKLAYTGLILIFISGIGAFMGGLFDVKHKLHGFSFLMGVPTLPVGAILVSYNLLNLGYGTSSQSFILWSAHATWMSLVLMAISMIVMMTGFKKSGIPMGPNIEPPKVVPEGVIALAGYANRILVICYIGWLIVISSINLTSSANL